MSRPWILGIICCSLIASSASVGWGQDYLDLPDEPQANEPTLADRFLSLKDKFKRNPQQAQQPTAKPSQRSNPRSPRYRNTAKQSLQSQRARRNNANPPVNTGAQPRPNVSDLLPDTKIFTRGSQTLPTGRQGSQNLPTARRPRAKQLTRASRLPTARNAEPAPQRPAPQRVVRKSPARKPPTRKSPSTTRANELDAALADLLKTKPVAQSRPVAIQPKPTTVSDSSRSTARKSPKISTAVPNNSFDLRKALLDDGEDSIAAEAAEAVEEATEPVIVKAPTVIVADSPLVAAPIVKTPEVAKPFALEPSVVPTQPRQSITIATPPKNSTFSEPVQRKATNDPFENVAKRVFDRPQQSSNPMRPFQAATEPTEPVDTLARPDSGIIQTTHQPVIVSHVEGPRSILVDREATYQVTLENTSNMQASNLSAEINVPEWAELVDAMSTSGVVKRRSDGANAGVLEWKLSELAKHSSQALRLRLIPRSGRPLQLGIRWSQAPSESQATVEVQEPKLELVISGPQEVRYGKPQRYRLTLRNPGTGLTEKVTLRLTPPGGDPQSVATQQIGNLKPGEVRDIDLELTAREAGELLIRADAFAEGGLKAETTKNVLCHKSELKVDWRGPDKKYAGTVAAYYFRVSNPGTASTEPVDMSVKLPAGTEFISASEGYSINATTGVVSWQLASIDVSEEQFMQLRCKIAREGKNDFEVRAKTSDGELDDSVAFQTDVVALADLKLEVSDPQGPLPLGESIVYQIRVRNRGTTNAENINVVGLFSEGIEPIKVEGAQFTIRDGRVSFHPIKSLPAGREVLLRIHAKAGQVGTHIFRTEVTCQTLDIKLAAEETTRFFKDEHHWEDGQTPYMAERESEATLKR